LPVTEAPTRFGFRKSTLINALWVPLQFQDTALITISIPAALATIDPVDHVRVFASVAALVSLVSMIVPPVAGGISDALRRRGVPRRAVVLTGAGLDVAALVMLAQVHALGAFVAFLPPIRRSFRTSFRSRCGEPLPACVVLRCSLEPSRVSGSLPARTRKARSSASRWAWVWVH
jgi:MFS family permease